MIFYLEKLHLWVKKQRCALILDQYTSHVADIVKNKAEELRIRLVFIPKSATDLFQPLDLRVFGTVKSIGSAIFDNFVFEFDTGFTKSQAADIFIRCWKQLSRQFVQSSWSITSSSDEDTGSSSSSDEGFTAYDSDYSSNRSYESEGEESELELRLKKR